MTSCHGANWPASEPALPTCHARADWIPFSSKPIHKSLCQQSTPTQRLDPLTVHRTYNIREEHSGHQKPLFHFKSIFKVFDSTLRKLALASWYGVPFSLHLKNQIQIMNITMWQGRLTLRTQIPFNLNRALKFGCHQRLIGLLGCTLLLQ
jgi:hypothetical protein